jgi:hypothetical protein
MDITYQSSRYPWTYARILIMFWRKNGRF